MRAFFKPIMKVGDDDLYSCPCVSEGGHGPVGVLSLLLLCAVRIRVCMYVCVWACAKVHVLMRVGARLCRLVRMCVRGATQFAEL